LGGQSAGATSAAANVISPGAKGLFARAIFESAPLLTIASKDLAEKRGSDFAKAAGCGTDASGEAASCLRGLPVDKIMKLQGTAQANSPFVNGFLVDGQILPIPADQAWATGQFNKMPIMNGNVQDEGGFVVSIDEMFNGPYTAEKYAGYIKRTFSGPAGPGNGPPNYPAGTADKVAARYPAGKYSSPAVAWIAVQTDPTACRNRAFEQLVADKAPLYAYEFQDRKAPWYFPQKLSFAPGAAHTSDIQFLFVGYHGADKGVPHPLSGAEKVLSDRLVAAWTNFMYTGNPNGKGDKPWPRYTADKPVLLAEKTGKLGTMTAAAFSAAHQCDFWDGITMYRTPGA
jgi:para-nitrobenzyl esterase